MAHHNRAVVAALLAAASLALTACTGQSDPTNTTSSEPRPTTAHTTPTDPGTGTDTDTFRTGQAADGGTFEPLTLPEGMPYGDGITPEDSFLDGSGLLKPGQDAAIYSGQWSKMSSYRSTFLFALDSTTTPLTGAEYDTAYTALGLAQGGTPHGSPIQKFTYRAREVASIPGEDDASTFDLIGTMTGLDLAGNTNFIMISSNGPLGCVGDPTPFDEHGWATGDTVQGCGYAVTLPGTDNTAWFYGIRMNGHLNDGAEAPRMFTTDVRPDDPSAGHDD